MKGSGECKRHDLPPKYGTINLTMGTHIEQITPSSFPLLLSQIPDPPKALYLRGKFPDTTQKFLAVVGSRKYTPYGKSMCEKLLQDLSGYPVVIVSGLALGIDSIAHEAALAAGLTTVAVPGSGLSDTVLYPRHHVNLAHRIVDAGGALLSEFKPDAQARPEHFPQRNRIMAGLSHAVLVVEAEERSGTLITARLALDYNRDVFAVPGPLSSSTTIGPHYLIRTGATLIRSGEDILEALGIPARTRISPNLSGLSPEEKKVLTLLSTPLPREELIEALGLSIHDGNVLISVLELKGMIVEELGVIRLQ
jgi:DNA processing protein